MGNEILVSQRARSRALTALVIAAAAAVTQLLLGLLWSGAGADPRYDEVQFYPGLTVPDAVLTALVLVTLLLFTLAAARRPRAAMAAWVLVGLTGLVVCLDGATTLAGAGLDGVIATAALDTEGGWLSLSPARLVAFALVLAAQSGAALLLLSAARSSLVMSKASFLLRCLVALPLATAIWAGVGTLPWMLTVEGQGTAFYLANAAIALLPATVYGTAIVLLFVVRPPRAAWLALLAVGLAYSLFLITLAWHDGLWSPALVPSLTLTVVSAVAAVRRGTTRAAVLP